MAVQFKFRSAVEFDTVEVDGPSISLCDLKQKIADHKNLSNCKDFDLLITNAETGEEYNEDNVSVPLNTSVIIKRVPAARPTLAFVLPAVESLAKASSIKITEKEDIQPSTSLPIADNNGFGDFGVDLYAYSEKGLPENYMDEIDNIAGIVSKTDTHLKRQSQGLDSGSQILENNQQVAAIKAHKMAFAKKADAILHKISSAELPSELKCSLCQSIFKEAVMIPCCQFSFCHECIRKVIIEKVSCPQCNSTKFNINDLLPNIALRQAIEHFLESQVVICSAEDCAVKNVPDRESAIQAKAASQPLSNIQGKQRRSQSPYANIVPTGKELHQIIPDSAGLSEGKKSIVDNGESGKLSKVPTSLSQKDEGMTIESQASKGKKRKKLLRHSFTDGTGNFVASGRSKRGDRRCYICGFPDHLARDCPDNSAPFLQSGMFHGGGPMYPGCVPGYASDTYWHAASLSHIRPFPSIYGPTPPAMQFDSPMMPVASYGIPPYMPSMYPGVPLHCGFMRMGSMGPALVAPSERPLSREEFMELQERERWRRLMQEQDRERIQEKADLVEGDFREHISQRTNDQQLMSKGAHHISHNKHDVDRDSVGNYSNKSNYQKSRGGKHTHKYSCDKYLDSNAIDSKESDSDESYYWKNRNGRHMQKHSREEYTDNSAYRDINSVSDQSDCQKIKSGRHARKQSHGKYAGLSGSQNQDLLSEEEDEFSCNDKKGRSSRSERFYGYSKASKFNWRKKNRQYHEDIMDRSTTELEEYGPDPAEQKELEYVKPSIHSIPYKSESGSHSNSYASRHKSRKDPALDLKRASYHKKDAKKYASPEYSDEDERVLLCEYPFKEEKLERNIQDGQSKSHYHKKQSHSKSEYDHCSSQQSKRRKRQRKDESNSLDRTRDTESNVVDDSEVHASRHPNHESLCHSQPTGSSLAPVEDSRWEMNTGFDSENEDLYFIYHTTDKQEHSCKKKPN